MRPVPNPQQRAAIEATGGVFVAAGAGTGKTAVLVERFVRAVVDEGLDVQSLLVITYTERAAGELRARIRERLLERGRPDLALELDGAWVSTIHGFCRRLLGAHPLAAGVDPAFRVLDEPQALVVQAEAFTAACVAGLGIIQTPLIGMRRLLASGRLVEILPEARAEPMPVTLLYAQRRNLSRRVQAFMAWLADTLAPHVV